jgi:archaellum component FlaC
MEHVTREEFEAMKDRLNRYADQFGNLLDTFEMMQKRTMSDSDRLSRAERLLDGVKDAVHKTAEHVGNELKTNILPEVLWSIHNASEPHQPSEP